MPSSSQILTVAQMRSAEQALIDAGTSVDALMQTAGRGAAEYVWRMAAHRVVTVLCGPGNNGGDGYVIAEAIRERGGAVCVIAATEPKTAAAGKARSLFQGDLRPREAVVHGDVLVDCLYGSGLTRGLAADDLALLRRLAAGHGRRIAVDVPSGVECDAGWDFGGDLPEYDLTIALGAWKFAHFLMPAAARTEALRLVGIGVAPVSGAGQMLTAPHFTAPDANAHKYRRGLVGVVTGEMPGAAVLAGVAAQGAGAGYVKLIGEHICHVPIDMVAQAGFDPRASALLVGPGLGRGDAARGLLAAALAEGKPVVVDADGLMLLAPRMAGPTVVTPHDGELAALDHSFGLSPDASKVARAKALARAGGFVVVAKGPDTVIAAPDGRLVCAPRATSWLAAAGTGDVLAGCVASRLAAGSEAFVAACEAVWLHGAAAQLCGPVFTAGQLAKAIPAAFEACL